ncbi:hypothetical protein AB0A77_31055 [Streptomyces varsoviensis]|uniref:hypothetical protein n=1 Tax=Streptomyces varsoviensis TaxID=67373 RepID=UPI003408D666
MNVREPRSRADSGSAEIIELREPTAASAAAGPGPRDRRRGRRLGYALVACGLALLPWLVVLALPATATRWTAAWIGLDALEALALIGTGLLAVRASAHAAVAAGATAALLVADAWFDITTAAPGPALATALAMALALELPLATLCTALALKTSSIAGRAR